MNVIVRDLVTGKTVTTDGEQFCKNCDVWFWTEGNGGCDCNRALLFEDDVDDEMDAQMRRDHPELKEEQSVCYGSKRFVIIRVDPMPEGYTLKDFNEDYDV